MQYLSNLFTDQDFINAVPFQTLVFPAKSVILAEDDEGQDLFLIQKGEVEVSYNLHDDAYKEPAKLARLTANDFFGELSLFDKEPRSAQFTAVTECNILKVSGPELIDYLDTHPAKGYFVLRELLLHTITYFRRNNMRTKMALQMYFHEHADD
ncbi:MAG: cyclic nucleotide-binding domain-containing protein [Methylomonas sp.]|nr:cyclic nucleotide-binding domain-containing protein [Methylomonas sp.]